MADNEKPSAQDPHSSNSEEKSGDDSKSSTSKPNNLSASQQEVLERCLHALTHAKDDSHILAALLLITRLCPASQLDRVTLHRVFEAVGFNLPARLLVTAVRGNETSGLPPMELLSLGTALLAALSTDAEMTTHPQLLSTIPLLLSLLEGEAPADKKQAQPSTNASETTNTNMTEINADNASTQTEQSSSDKKVPISHVNEAVHSPAFNLDEAVVADCYQVLNTVCALPRGPDQLLSRGAVPALCRAVSHKQTLSHEMGLPLLAHVLSSSVRQRAWNKHSSELLSLLDSMIQNCIQASDQNLLDICTRIPQFLPPPGGKPQNPEFKDMVDHLWAKLRPVLQAKLSPEQLGPVLVLSACLLDLCGWDPVGPPKICCLLVNRACVEVRMLLEEPPGTPISAEQQHTLTACYRIIEAAMEQACSPNINPAQPNRTSLSLQQSRQVLGVMQEAFSAIIYYLQQIDSSCYDDPFLFATFRCICAWLAEETSCLKEEITALLPFFIGYTKHHLQERKGKGLADWMSEMSVSDGLQTRIWTGDDVLKYLLPALCHLSAEEGPRKVLLSLETPAVLVDFLSRGLEVLKSQSGKTVSRDSSLETACSALLNFAVTEAEYVRNDISFGLLEELLTEALPILLHKSLLLVLTANICTLGLMMYRLKPTSTGPVSINQKSFFSSALRFLCGALQPGKEVGQAQVSTMWSPWWEEVCELWRLSLQALGGCVNAQPWIATLVREEGWLHNILTLLESSCGLPDTHSQEALEEALCAIAHQCPPCRQDISTCMKKKAGSSLHCMIHLRKVLMS